MFREHKKKLEQAVSSYLPAFRGARIGIYVQSLSKKKDSASVNGDDIHYAASLIKIPIMVEVFKQVEEGQLSLDEKLVVDHEYALDPEDDVTQLRKGRKLAVKELLLYSILNSDNEAANILADRVTIPAINNRMNELGLYNTKMSHLMCEVYEEDMINTGVLDGCSNTTTPKEMCSLLGKIYIGDICNGQYTQMMIKLLEEFRGYGQHLWNVNTGLGVGLPANVRIGIKGGRLEDCMHCVGVIDGSYSIALMISDLDRRNIAIRPIEFIVGISNYIFKVYAEKTKPGVFE